MCTIWEGSIFAWCVLATVLLLWRDTRTKASPTKKALSLGLVSCFRGFVNEHHGRRDGGMQASRDLRSLHPNTQADKQREREGGGLRILVLAPSFETSKAVHSYTLFPKRQHLLQQ